MELDKELIQGRIDIIDRNLKFLDLYSKIDKKNFIDSYKDIQAVKYSLFEIIEACLDIASHIISVKGFERAESYSEMFWILGTERVIDSELAERLSGMAKFRNVLIHTYSKVDNLKVLEFVKNELKDIRQFTKKVLETL